MVFAQPGVDAIRLTNGIPYFGTVSGTDLQFFYVEVPNCATVASNVLVGDLGTLLLFGDREGLPRATVSAFLDDYGPYLNLESGGLAQFTLTTLTPPSAPLIPGQRYYLGVRNFQPDLTNNAYGIRVQFDCVDPLLPTVPSLTNGIPFRATIDPGPGLHYYQFVVSSNAIRTDFELTPIGGNVDMYVRYGRIDDYPLPSPNLYDYASADPDPTAVDAVAVERLSLPIPLVPGVWYVAIRNAENRPVDYTIRATETYTTIINLTNAVAYTNSIAPSDPSVGLLSGELQYYAFQVASNSVVAHFETLGADGDVNLYVRKGLPIPTPFDYHLAGVNFGLGDEFISVTNTATPLWLSPGWWFLTVENADVTNVTYAIRATEFPATIIPLTNNVPFTNTVALGVTPDYYSFQVSPSALSAKFEVFDMSDDVHLLLRQGLPVPTFNDLAYASTNAGLVAEEIELTAFSFPLGLTPGDWYLSVIHAGTNGPATYTVLATEQTANIVVLTNGIPQNAAIPPGAALDYYQFTVSPTATAAEFKLTSAGAGDLDLFLRKGPPLPNPLNAHYLALTPGPGDELIRLDTNSIPVPLSPGIWYLAVTNKEAFPIGYEITATEFGVVLPPPTVEITDLVITTNRVCITWNSVPGTNYFVVGRTNALEAVWTPISPTLVATDLSTTWCLEPIGPWRFFDVRIGDSPVDPIADPTPILTLEGTDICVSWASVPGTNYFVEAKKAFNDPNWAVLTPSITATDVQTKVCYPIDWGYRFFRVGAGQRTPPTPTPLPPELVDIDAAVDRICITWPTQAGLDYLLEAKANLDDPNWTVASEPLRGLGVPYTLCLNGSTGFRYFRVVEGVSIPSSAPPSVPVPSVTLSVDAAFQLCLTWDTLLGAEYFVEAKERFADAVWTVISPILPSTGLSLSFCQPLNSQWRYFQVRRVNSLPEPPLVIASIEVTATGALRIMWNGSASARYQVFFSDELPPVWNPVGGAVTSLTGDFEFTDDGTETAPMGTFRLYRLQRLP